MPRSHDTEAITFLPEGCVALGTETRASRKTDEILIAQRDDDAFHGGLLSLRIADMKPLFGPKAT